MRLLWRALTRRGALPRGVLLLATVAGTAFLVQRHGVPPEARQALSGAGERARDTLAGLRERASTLSGAIREREVVAG